MLNQASNCQPRRRRPGAQSPSRKRGWLRARIAWVVALCLGLFLLQTHPGAADDTIAPARTGQSVPVDRRIPTLLHHLETQVIDGRVISPADDNAVDTWATVLTQLAAAPDTPGLKQTLADFVVSLQTDAKTAQAADKIETATYLLTFAELANNLAQHGFNTALGQPEANGTVVPPALPRLDEPQHTIPGQDLALGTAPASPPSVAEDPVPSLAPAPEGSQLPVVTANPLPDDTPDQGLIPAPATPAPAAQAFADANATGGPVPHDTPVVPAVPPAAAATRLAPTAMPTPADPLPDRSVPAATAPAAKSGGPPPNARLAETAASPAVTRAPAPSVAAGAQPSDTSPTRTAASTSGSSAPAGSVQFGASNPQTATASPAAAAPVMSPTSDGTTQVAAATPATQTPSPGTDDHTSSAMLDDHAARLALETHDGAAAAALIGQLVRSEALQPTTDAALLARGDAMMRNKDIAAARKLYQSAANAGSARAALSLAQSYDPAFTATSEPKGAAPDTGRAITWYRRAADLGVPGAQTRLQALMTKTTR